MVVHEPRFLGVSGAVVALADGRRDGEVGRGRAQRVNSVVRVRVEARGLGTRNAEED